MIDGPKVAKYLNETGLKMQEFWFLYSVMCMEENIRDGSLRIPQNDDNKSFNEHLHFYFENQTPNIGNDELKWSDVAYALEKEGWVDIIQPGGSPLKLKFCFTTEKFKSHFLISDIEKAFTEFLSYYPKFVYANGTKYSAIDLAPEKLMELYNVHILKKGNALLHQRCLSITEMYVRDNDGEAPYKLSNYIENKYYGIALGYEEGEFKKNRSSTGRRIG